MIAVPPPSQQRCPIAIGEWTVVGNRGGHAINVVLRVKGFRADQVRKGILPAPVASWIDGEPRGPGVDLAGIKVPAIFVGFATMKRGSFKPDRSMSQAER